MVLHADGRNVFGQVDDVAGLLLMDASAARLAVVKANQ
jgi:hypothetical protein